MRDEAFERYLEIFYKRPCIDIVGDNLEEEEHVDEKEEPYSADLGGGFFPIRRQSTKVKKGTGASAESIAEKMAPKPIMSLSMSEFEPVTLENDDKGLVSVKEQSQMSR